MLSQLDAVIKPTAEVAKICDGSSEATRLKEILDVTTAHPNT
jgi:hypothetical protein